MRTYYIFWVLLGFIYLTLSPSAYGTPTVSTPLCLANASQYTANKDQLPRVLQGLETSFRGKMYKLSGVKRLFASAAVKLRIADNKKFIFDVAVASPDQLLYAEEVYISKFCYDGAKVTFYLENKTSYTATITGDDAYEMAGGTFESTTPAEFAAEVEKVKAKLDPNTATSSKSKPASTGGKH